jgi:6-phosphogluconolactonase
LALAGGATPKALYARLAVDPNAPPLDWKRVHLFFSDERCVPPQHPDSNFGMVKGALLDHIKIPAANVHRWRGEETVPSVAAAAYAQELQRPLDLALLGLGADGHTASLFPHTSVLHETVDPCAAVDVPALHTTRLTLTTPVFVETHELLFLVTGTEKAEILCEVVTGPLRPLDLPSQVLVRRPRSDPMRPSSRLPPARPTLTLPLWSGEVARASGNAFAKGSQIRQRKRNRPPIRGRITE